MENVVSHWDVEDQKDIIQGIDATDGHPTGAGFPYGWQGGFFCVDCQQHIGVADLDSLGRHPSCGKLIVPKIDRMKSIGRKIREQGRGHFPIKKVQP